jgi:hypothetical protein
MDREADSETDRQINREEPSKTRWNKKVDNKSSALINENVDKLTDGRTHEQTEIGRHTDWLLESVREREGGI